MARPGVQEANKKRRREKDKARRRWSPQLSLGLRRQREDTPPLQPPCRPEVCFPATPQQGDVHYGTTLRVPGHTGGLKRLPPR